MMRRRSAGSLIFALACWECMSISLGTMADNVCKVTDVSLTKILERPEDVSSRRTVSSETPEESSIQSMPFSSSNPRNSGSTSVNNASTTDFDPPSDITFVSARPPMTRESAPSIIDFPAPVSPVMMVRPGPNSRSRCSISA